MDRSAGSTNLTNHSEEAMETNPNKPTQRQRYERKHAQLRATLKDGDPLKTVLDGLGGLSEAELKLINELRRLRAEEAKPLEVPESLLEHSYLTPAQAARALGVSRAEMLRHLDPSTWSRNRIGYTKDRLFPASEVLRYLKRMHREELERKARDVAKLVMGNLERSFSGFTEDLVEARNFLPAETVAAELGMSRAAVDRLMREDGPDTLYSQRHKHRRGWCVTREELDAFKRKLAARQGGKAAA